MTVKKKNYPFRTIETAMKCYWAEKKVWKATVQPGQPKRYILDMFPYPSGSGLHVGHLVGYFASDAQAIIARMEGAQVLHPMGFDAFGLPAEQYAIQTGQPPAVTTAQNVRAYRQLLETVSLSFDWERSVITTDPDYYRWTQWIFLQLFDSWYDPLANRAAPISSLRNYLAQYGNGALVYFYEKAPRVTATEWREMDEKSQQHHLSYYRLAYLAETRVNWCPALKTVLANDEVINGYSERGGHPVEQRKMWQWSLRITAYAARLLDNLVALDWPEDVKTTQRHWIGRSQGVRFPMSCAELPNAPALQLFTTRIDTLFGITFIALSPDHPLVAVIIEQSGGSNVALIDYVKQAKHYTEREAKVVNTPSGVATGYHALHPITGEKLPIWVANYVLGDYGTGAVMGVPGHDERDHRFARYFDLPIFSVIAGQDVMNQAYEGQEGCLTRSSFVDGLSIEEAQVRLTSYLEEHHQGQAVTCYRLRDAIFSRQRYWGEPIPVYYRDGVVYPMSEEKLPLLLPPIDVYQPTATGEPPLSRVPNWHTAAGHPLEKCTMPAWAGSSWYFLRYMDPHNKERLVGETAAGYWREVDLYVGGKEHATGHLIYARFFTMFLHDRDWIPFEEPFRKLVNQGMIQNHTAFVHRIVHTNQFVSDGLKAAYNTVPMRVDLCMVGPQDALDIAAFKDWRPDLADATFILEDGVYRCQRTLEKMSKSKYNTADPQPIIDRYGADVLRLYLLFLGPIPQAKIWNSRGIEGVVRFMKKVWKLFQRVGESTVIPAANTPPRAAMRALHQAIKRVRSGVERMAMNTSISGLMILVNKLLTLPCTHHDILSNTVRLLAPFAPHMAEYLWQQLENSGSVMHAGFPDYDPVHLATQEVVYPVAINGKVYAQLTCDTNSTIEEIQQAALQLPLIQKRLVQQKVGRILVVPQRMVNIVLRGAT